jgi:excisionase family DNA binding protein
MNPSEHPENRKLLWTTREAAAAMNISPRTLWTLTAEHKIRCVRIRRSVRYDPEDIRRFIETQKAMSEASQDSQENP